MSNILIFLIIFIYLFSSILKSHSCDFLNPIDIQSATYSHSLILRIQPMNMSDEYEEKFLVRKVLVQEILKNSPLINSSIQSNDMIIIHIDKELDEILEDSCWQLLRETNIDSILFLNESISNQFYLHFPPVQSTYRVREDIDAVLNYDTYAPQVLIKTRLIKPISSQNYSVQCLTRGNPLPRLFWSKNNQTLEYYPSIRQCKTTLCRIYSIQNKYHSILYFRFLTHTDSGFYTCHAENAINHTLTSIYVDVNQTNHCTNLNNCHQRGQCLFIKNQFQCLCVNPYFGDQCEMNADDLLKKPNSTKFLFRSRLILFCLLGFLFLIILFFSCIFTRNQKKKTNSIKRQNNHFEISKLTQVSSTRTDNQHLQAQTNCLILAEDYRRSNFESSLIPSINFSQINRKSVSFS